MYDEQKSVDVISPSSILLSHLSDDLKRRIDNGKTIVGDIAQWDDIMDPGVYCIEKATNVPNPSIYTYGTLVVFAPNNTKSGRVQIYISDKLNGNADILIRTRWNYLNPWRPWTKVQTTPLQ